MMTIFAEQPWLISGMIALLVVGLFVAWTNTGEKNLAISGIVIALLIPGAFIVANAIETDREAILRTIETTAAAAEQNDRESVVVVIADRETRQRALNELSSYEFERVRVGNIKIQFVEGSLPLEATVDLDATVRGGLASGRVQGMTIPRRVILTMQKQSDGQWKVIDYTHVSLTGDPDGFTPNRI
ncbi:hypothetical protein U8335_21985 [Roseiconus lacunae]|uniref:DUF4440 domain-containing protein n=1 Tax=Roseiconus lacunae TaxID=2605694 RepID=A0ABT7PCT7_9BACT|nr:hypothetical protein [Roseiconus lacunae]MCD0459599.1 hypothetical protein [Roseiconus lacunae]MDM4014297.1 hypothetical protein [Roseiconus lacunae]WRQ49615.1 hypothetical protein U8335_21985 [Stieleria sp. HD01]